MANAAGEVGLSVVRKAIEQHVSKEQAPTVLFEALSELPEGEDIPRTLGALTIFVAGPLSKILHRYLGHDRGVAAVDAVKASLREAAAMAEPVLEVPGAPGVPIDVTVSDSDWPDIEVDDSQEDGAQDVAAGKRPTLVMAGEETIGDTVRVMVVARTARLAQRIRAAFGGHRVTVSFGARFDELSERLDEFAPSIVIIDGQDAADVTPAEIAELLIDAPEAILVLVWASDQPWGSAALSALKSSGATYAPIPRNAGVEPMLDYIRARFASA